MNPDTYDWRKLASTERSEIAERSVLDGIQIEVGKEYWFKYKHCESQWAKRRVTRFTDMGYPWAGNGIRTDDSYYVREVDTEPETPIATARIAVQRLNNPAYYTNGAFTPIGEDLLRMFMLGTSWTKRYADEPTR